MKHKIKPLFLVLLLFTHQTIQPVDTRDVVGVVSFGAIASLVVSVFLRTIYFDNMCQYNFHRFVKYTNPSNFFWKYCHWILKDNEAFQKACLANSQETIAELLKYSTIEIGENLRWAVKKNLVDVVKLLLARPNVDVNKKCYDDTPIRIAVEKGHVEIVELLLNDSRIDPNPSKFYINPLCCAIKNRQLKVLELLLKSSKVNKNILAYGMNILHMAIEKDWLEGVKLIIPHVDVQEKWIESPILHYAAQKNAVKVFPYLLSILDLDVKEKSYSGTCLDAAVYEGKYKIVQILRDHKKFTEHEVRQSLRENIKRGKAITVIKNIPLIEGVKEGENIFFTGIYQNDVADSFERDSLCDFYITAQGNLNKRNAEMLRPLDMAYQWYISQGINENTYESKDLCKAKKNIYFELLQLTPSWSRATLEGGLEKWLPTRVCKHILGMYVGLYFPEVPQKDIVNVAYPKNDPNKRLVLS